MAIRKRGQAGAATMMGERGFAKNALGSALGTLVLSGLSLASLAAEPIEIVADPIAQFRGAGIGDPIDGLVYAGGLRLTAAHPDFGGLSGLSFLDESRFVMVTDRGRFVSGTLDLADGVPHGLSDVQITALTGRTGIPLSGRDADAEAVEVVMRAGAPAAVRVGFERAPRVFEYDLIDGRPVPPARAVGLPDWLYGVRGNQSIESVCIAPPASPVAGSTLIITEGHSRETGTWAATLLGIADRGDLAILAMPGVNPTDCAFLPDGDLLVLERGLSFFSFSVQIRRIPADSVRAGEVMIGDVILFASGMGVDNFEGIDARILPDGRTRLTILSDDNFIRFQRTLLLEFDLPG